MKSIRAYLVAAAVIIASPVTITHADEPPLGDPPVVNVDPSCGVTITGEKVEIKNEEGEIIGEVNKLWLRVNDDDNNADEKWDIGSEQVAGEDDTYQITVTATLKDTCVASETGGIRVKVYMDDASKDRIDGFWPGKRIIKDENGASTEETGDDALAKVKGVPKEYPYYVPILPGQSVTQTLYIEGIHHSAAASDVIIRAETTDTNHCTKHGIKTAESLSLSAYQVDLDVDSNNNEGFVFTWGSDKEDWIENSATVARVVYPGDVIGTPRPGKVVLSNNRTDSASLDQLVNGGKDGLTAVSAGLQFVPVLLELKEPFDPATAMVTFTYVASEPGISDHGISETETAAPYVCSINTGGMRLWKKDATGRTSVASVLAATPGDFIPASTETEIAKIDWSKIATDISTPRKAKLYLEYVDKSTPEDAGLKPIKVTVTGNGATTEDQVNVTLIPVEIKEVWSDQITGVEANGFPDKTGQKEHPYILVGATKWGQASRIHICLACERVFWQAVAWRDRSVSSIPGRSTT